MSVRESELARLPRGELVKLLIAAEEREQGHASRVAGARRRVVDMAGEVVTALGLNLPGDAVARWGSVLDAIVMAREDLAAARSALADVAHQLQPAEGESVLDAAARRAAQALTYADQAEALRRALAGRLAP